MARAADMTTFDSANAVDQTSISSLLEIYDRLVKFGPNGQVLPDLATSWKFSDGNKRLTFTLRPGVKFSDGTPLTPADVVLSLQRAANPKSSYGVLWGDGTQIGDAIKSVAPLGSNQVVITLNHTFAPLLSSLATFCGSVYSAANYNKYGHQAFLTHPIGTGAYMVKAWNQGSQLTLVRNPNYWGPRPTIGTLIFKVVGDDNTRALELESGAVDAIDTVAPQQVANLKSHGFNIENVVGQSVLLIPLNEKVKPFNDVNVRLALASALDRASIAKTVFFGLATPAASPLASGTLFYQPNWSIPYDLTKAKAYLAKSSVPKGFSFTLTIPSGNTADQGVATIWSNSLAKIGVTAKIQQIEATTAQNRWAAGQYQAYIQPWANDTPDAFEYSVLGLAGQQAFYTYWVSPEAAKLTVQGATALSQSARQQAYTGLQSLAAAQQPQPYVVDLPILWASSTKVTGFSPNQQGNYLLESAKTG
jgi:peptide/nickel transport system substrate-binding protein